MCFAEPRWASVNRGVLICDECCSIHRGLGRHSSQVRHLTQSSWPQSQLQVSNTRAQPPQNKHQMQIFPVIRHFFHTDQWTRVHSQHTALPKFAYPLSYFSFSMLKKYKCQSSYLVFYVTNRLGSEIMHCLQIYIKEILKLVMCSNIQTPNTLLNYLLVPITIASILGIPLPA